MHTRNQDANSEDDSMGARSALARSALERLWLLDVAMLAGYLGLAAGMVGGLAVLSVLAGALGDVKWPFLLLMCGGGLVALGAVLQQQYARTLGQTLAARQADIESRWAEDAATVDEIRECLALRKLKVRESALITTRQAIKRMLNLTLVALILYLWADHFLIGQI